MREELLLCLTNMKSNSNLFQYQEIIILTRH